MKLVLIVIPFVSFFSFTFAVQSTINILLESKKYLDPPMADSHDGETVETKWILQRLNNFNLYDTRTWQMRYMENNYFLKNGGPIFIFVGGELKMLEEWLLGGHMRDMAIKLNGSIYYVEHRYYGESRPTVDLSPENLQFLTVDQALADLARFILHIKKTNPLLSQSRVILVGASYSASLVTWFMQRYPYLANGAWASSAPLTAQVDFSEYREIVSEAFETIGGSNCSERIKAGFEELEQLVAAGDSNRIKKLFNLCFPFDTSNKLDVWNFFTVLSNAFSYVVQSHREINQDIQKSCQILLDKDVNSAIESLSHWWMYQNPSCFNHKYSNFVSFYNNTNWDYNQFWFGVRQWTYQTCTEFGWFQSTSSNNILFGSGVDVKLPAQICNDFFGSTYSLENVRQSVYRTNVVYRGRHPNVRNVYSTHGQFDPWRPMGVQQDINPYSPTVILPMESHCSDLYSINWTDSPELKASKERIFELVQQWIVQ